MGSSQLHLVVDGRGPDIQRAPENEWKTQHVVDLVGIVRTAGSHDDVFPGRFGFIIENLGNGVRQSEYDRIRCHGEQEFFLQHTGHGKAQKHIRILDGFFQCMHIALCRILHLVLVHVFPVDMQHPFAVEHDHILPLDPQFNIEV